MGGSKIIPFLPNGHLDAHILVQNPLDLYHKFVPMPSVTSDGAT